MKNFNIALVALLTPLVVTMVIVNLFITHLFLSIEYRMPWFPPDSFGFTLSDRLKFGNATIDYLRFGEDVQDLNSIKFEDGSSIYNEREISHLVDVKNVIDQLNLLLGLALIYILIMVLFSILRKDFLTLRNGFLYGSIATLVSIFILGIFAVVSFWRFFAWFHSIFFQGDSWLFQLSDSLIRLFPLVFWQDAVLYILGLVVIINLAIALVLKRKTG